MIFIGKILMGIILLKCRWSYVFFLCSLSDSGDILTNFVKIFMTVFKFADTILIGKNSQGHNSVKNVRGLTFFFLSAHRLMMVYICTNYENILDIMKVIERARFS